MEEKRIALVLKTVGLEYDDRVRKEILTIQKLYPNIKFKIFVMLPDNVEREGVTDYGVPYKSVFLPARVKYPSGEKVFLKGWQFYKAIKKDLKNFDAVWTANLDSFFVTTFVKTKHLIWDLHELPYQLFGSGWKRWILKHALNRCEIVIHANPQRAQYMKSIHLVDDMSKHYAIRNYPNFEDIDSEYDEMYNNFVKWKGDRRCVYLQGLSVKGRAAYESVAAVMQELDLCAVVIGGYYQQAKDKLKEQYGEELERRIFFVGRVAQLKIPQYVKQCFMSLVFYENVRPNNWYCEANRFYQSVIMGLPVVVGANPPMKELVEKYGFGVSIDDDGTNVGKIVDGIHTVMSNYEQYMNNNKRNRDALIWSKQEGVFRDIIEKVFG